MRLFLTLVALAFAAPLHADSAYKLDLGASVEQGSLKVEPTIIGPAGKAVRYEMDVKREGRGGTSNSSQSGTVQLGSDGRAQLASNSVSVTPADTYRVTVRVFDGGRVVAEQSTRYP
jgi:Thin aggregative fimbriae synthesis protein